MNCAQCEHKSRPQGGHCYMFATQPTGKFCAQYKATDTIRIRISTIAAFVTPPTLAPVIEHKSHEF